MDNLTVFRDDRLDAAVKKNREQLKDIDLSSEVGYRTPTQKCL